MSGDQFLLFQYGVIQCVFREARFGGDLPDGVLFAVALRDQRLHTRDGVVLRDCRFRRFPGALDDEDVLAARVCDS